MTAERNADTPGEPPSVAAVDEDEAMLVWNGMVSTIHRVPWPDAPPTIRTRPAEAAEPVTTRAPA